MIHKSLSRVGIALLVLTSAGFAQNYFFENFNSNSKPNASNTSANRLKMLEISMLKNSFGVGLPSSQIL